MVPRSSADACLAASRALQRSSMMRVSTTSSIGKFANDMCRRRNWVSALLGSDVKKVPLSGPTPTPDRTTPWASMARIASRTAARLTPSFAARSRSAGNWSPTFSAPAIIWLSIWLITSS